MVTSESFHECHCKLLNFYITDVMLFCSNCPNFATEPFLFSVLLTQPLQSLIVSLLSSTKTYLTHFVNVLMWACNQLFPKGASFSGEWYLKIIFWSLKEILLLNKS